MKEKILIYPYDVNMAPVLRHCKLLKNFEIAGVISPIGWNLCGKDASYADCGEQIGFRVESDFYDFMEKWDTVLICESEAELDFEKYIKPKIFKSIESGKNILCCNHLDAGTIQAISSACNDKGVYFKYFNQECLFQDIQGNTLYKIDSPVIFVTGVSSRTHKFEIQLGLREKLINMGYNVSQVGSRNYCELLDFHSFPSFMFSTSISESTKIFMFNQFIKNIEDNEKPDLIIIGIPGGIMPLNDTYLSNFGILAFEISHAITPDFSILSALYDDFKPQYFDMLSTTLKYKLGFELDCFNMANVQFDRITSKEQGKMIFLTFDYKFIDSKESYKDINVPIFNILNNESLHDLAKNIIDKLENYAYVEVI